MVGYQTLRDASCYEMGTRSRAGVLTPRQSGLLGTSARCHPRGRSRRFGFQPRSLRGTSTPCPWARAHQIALSWGGPSRQDGSWARGGRRAALCWMRLSARTQRDGQGALTRRTRRTLLSWGVVVVVVQKGVGAGCRADDADRVTLWASAGRWWWAWPIMRVLVSRRLGGTYLPRKYTPRRSMMDSSTFHGDSVRNHRQACPRVPRRRPLLRPRRLMLASSRP